MPKKNTQKKPQSQIVAQHLENVSGKLLDEYHEVIRDMIRGRHGIYALYRNEKLYYIGLANNLMARLKHHLRDRHRGKWDRFSVYLTTKQDHIKGLESLLLRIANPSGNRVSGKIPGSANLLSNLNRLAKDFDDERRVHMLGGKVQSRRTKRKLKNVARGQDAASIVARRRMALRATYKGKTYKATLRTDGTVSLNGKSYSSFSSAGQAVVGHAINGWSFWWAKNAAGDWVRMREFR